MNWLRANLTFANVMASMAMFIALGGTSYAALKLPRNSVGSEQMRRGAVTSRVVRDRALSVRDLSVSARASLRGLQGPAGPPGPATPTLRAVVSPVGDLVGGNAQGLGHVPAGNEYRVRFDRDLAGCAFAATLAAVPSGAAAPPPGRITLAIDGTSVVVRTFDLAGAATAGGFHLVGGC